MEPNGKFKGVTLLEGLVVTKDEGKASGASRKNGREQFAIDVKKALSQRISSVMNVKVVLPLQIFDATSLLSFNVAIRVKSFLGFDIDEGECGQLGVAECLKLMKTCSQMLQFQYSRMNFDPRMSHKYMSRTKKTFMQEVWKGLCIRWFSKRNRIEDRVKADATLYLIELYLKSLQTLIHCSTWVFRWKHEKSAIAQEAILQLFLFKHRLF